MGDIWLHDLDDVIAPLVGNGVTELVLRPGWMTRARVSGGLDAFDGWLWHHTVSGPASDPVGDTRYIADTNPYAPSPICQLYFSRTGAVHLIAAGAANHGGSGGAWRPGGPTVIGINRANTRLGSSEIANWGNGELYPWRQIFAAISVAAAISIAEGWKTPLRHLGHKEYCGPGTTTPGRKIDPYGPWENHPHDYWPKGSSWGGMQGDLDLFRLLVAKRIRELLTDPPHLEETCRTTSTLAPGARSRKATEPTTRGRPSRAITTRLPVRAASPGSPQGTRR